MLIGISGKKESGKDTVANYLVNNYGFEKYNLADPMKKAIQLIFNFTDEQLWGNKKEIVDERWNTTPRKVMQTFATDYMQFDIYRYLPEIEKQIPRRTFWVLLFKDWYKKKLYMDDILFKMDDYKEKKRLFNAVVADIRFPHEAEGIRDMGGQIWYIGRKCKDNQHDMHISETEMSKIIPDIVINNNGTIIDLFRTVSKIMEEKK